ncbi:MAG: hypothetical protein HQK77_10310 [Desulfobacterales bacterium]|nr:hypothetical protein [Desulfobacterales bacterium]
MKEIFGELFELTDIQGVLYYSFEGKLEFDDMSLIPEKIEKDWEKLLNDRFDFKPLLTYFENIQDVEFFFENRRIYIKKISTGFIVVLLGNFLPIGVVRLNCELIAPSLENIKKSKGLGWFFKKKR